MVSQHTLAVIIRASGENTLKALIKIIKKQLLPEDVLVVLEKEVCFEDKLKLGFQKAIELNKDFTVFIDADILLRKNALRKVRENLHRLEVKDFGFGFLLFDRFYEEPKFRGFHVYRTEILKKAINFVPNEGEQLRPETFVKNQLKKEGYTWQNHLTRYVAGIHDFYQSPKDIFYKYLVRGKRSQNDIDGLIRKFEKSNVDDFAIALEGIQASKKMDSISNNKYLYNNSENNFRSVKIIDLDKLNVDIITIHNLFKKYKFNSLFWKSLA
ncbi:hypothetical protein SAMN04488096_101345 [Mesonia phycicola]|uniref:Glycosyl transferase family 2 n=1 Tax=Mesonia phycicola TaxID=579105 RepID=A0A1M6AML2_9FLAO|nr:hypothetical protein [Mesonia phycicola]SHI37685.1 hypothetical protein SAMN04488096_101345 [Mesonia phycicola]